MAGEEETIGGLYQAILDHWNRRDAPGLAQLLIDDALLIGFDGSQMQGAAAVRDELARIFADDKPARGRQSYSRADRIFSPAARAGADLATAQRAFGRRFGVEMG